MRSSVDPAAGSLRPEPSVEFAEPVAWADLDPIQTGLVVSEVERVVSVTWQTSDGRWARLHQVSRSKIVPLSRTLRRSSRAWPPLVKTVAVLGSLALIALAAVVGRSYAPDSRSAERSAPQGIEIILPPPPEPARPYAAAPGGFNAPEPAPKRHRQRLAPTPAVPDSQGAATLSSSAAAVERALKSDGVETWSENGVDGFASAGPLRVEGRQGCRDVTIWRRGGGQGEAVTTKRCAPLAQFD